MTNYQSLTAWQRAHELCLETFRATGSPDGDRAWTLYAELRRAALRIPSSIAKATAFTGERGFTRYLGHALAFAIETQYLIGVTAELEYLPGRSLGTLRRLVTETIPEIYRLLEEVRS
jgi:four helix bundle protein